MEGGKVRSYFGRRLRVGGAEVLKLITQEEVPAEKQTGGDLERELAYGNHRNVKYREEVLINATTDIASGRAIVFPVPQAKELGWLRRRRTFEGGVTVRKDEGSNEPGNTKGIDGILVNVDTDYVSTSTRLQCVDLSKS